MTKIILTRFHGRWMAYPDGAPPSVRIIGGTVQEVLGALVQYYPTSCGLEIVEEAMAPWAGADGSPRECAAAWRDK